MSQCRHHSTGGFCCQTKNSRKTIPGPGHEEDLFRNSDCFLPVLTLDRRKASAYNPHIPMRRKGVLKHPAPLFFFGKYRETE
nr:hypothetical protein [uncultured bacterium]